MTNNHRRAGSAASPSTSSPTKGLARGVIAIDVGGTFMKGMISSMQAEPIFTDRIATGVELGPSQVVDRIIQFAESLAAKMRVGGVEPSGLGLAVPGWVDEHKGIAIDASNIGWENVDLQEALQSRLNIPVVIRHDVRAGALAELERGAATNHHNFVFVPIGTGIGSALVLSGKIFTGDHYLAGEIGHIRVSNGSEPCGCGRVGCLETIASAAAIARRYANWTGQDIAGAHTVAEAVAAGDVIAERVWADAVNALCEAILLCNTILDIDLYVIGGGLAMSEQQLLEPLADAIAVHPHDGVRPTVMAARLGDNAGCVGAALAIIQHINHDFSPPGAIE